MLKTAPAVFAVENEYQIMVNTTRPALFSVLVGDEEYFDESNGILRSLSDLHRVCVPMAALDAAGKYTVRVRPLIERKPYFTETEEPLEFEFPFILSPPRTCGPITLPMPTTAVPIPLRRPIPLANLIC
ncbi:MAG: hypothetical protein IJY22_00750 [Clostridia bacterium]|nr:hypothetical protein [Clostridia bacterium]